MKRDPHRECMLSCTGPLRSPLGRKGRRTRRFYRVLLVLILMVGLGCAHRMSESAGPRQSTASKPNGRERAPAVEEKKEKPTTTWDDVIEGLGFLLRWIPEDVIIFPFGP